jgi:hypothetical protein
MGESWVLLLLRFGELFSRPGIIEGMSGTLQRILHDFAFAPGAHFRM